MNREKRKDRMIPETNMNNGQVFLMVGRDRRRRGLVGKEREWKREVADSGHDDGV